MNIQLKRIYEAPEPDDGLRILVDRLWPRGISKERASLDEWMKEIAPSRELCKWFDHEPSKFAEFRDSYVKELETGPERAELADRLRQSAAAGKVTLLYAAKDTVHNQAQVLLEWLSALA